MPARPNPIPLSTASLLPLQDVHADYRLGKVVGRGQFGTVRLAVKKGGEREGAKFACKSIPKSKLQ